MKTKRIYGVIFLAVSLLSACNSPTESKVNVEPAVETEANFEGEKPLKAKSKKQHPFGGWSCPDNLRGFPPVNIQDLEKIKVVEGRLPTKEETENGTSLLYFDPFEHSTARPLDISLPQLARCYSEYTKKNELVVIIQAVEVENDTIVGFRYLNGGNGSAYFNEVVLMKQGEIEKLGSTPFVSKNIEIKAPKAKIWEVITNPEYAKTLGEIFDKNAYMESDWENGSKVYFKYGPDNIAATGIITASWKDLYIQVDYNFEGYHYAEKFLILNNDNEGASQFHIACGPYGEDFEAQKVVWDNWLQKVKELSENK